MEETQPSAGAAPPAGGIGGGGASGGGRPGGRWYDPTPLLRHHRLRYQPAPGLARGAAAGRSVPFLIGRATTRRLMRSPSMAVRQTAALQLEERHTDWGYSRPVVALDLVWSLAFVLVSCSVLLATARERPSTPIRVWILGYALHCLVHVGFVCFEYRRRQRRTVTGRDRWAEVGDGDEEEEEEGSDESRQSRVMKKLESANAVISFFWWMLGFYWIVVGGQALLQDAPRLYWLTVVFLAFDVFFAIFCILLACIIGVALCCCLPCIIAILYAVTGQEGASDADLSSLPRFRFRKTNESKVIGMDKERVIAMNITENCNTVGDLSLSSEDSDCCICLSQYEDGVELCTLPCSHHFHSGCIVKWLRINATCPLCKYCIRKGDEQV